MKIAALVLLLTGIQLLDAACGDGCSRDQFEPTSDCMAIGCDVTPQRMYHYYNCGGFSIACSLCCIAQ